MSFTQYLYAVPRSQILKPLPERVPDDVDQEFKLSVEINKIPELQAPLKYKLVSHEEWTASISKIDDPSWGFVSCTITKTLEGSTGTCVMGCSKYESAITAPSLEGNQVCDQNFGFQLIENPNGQSKTWIWDPRMRCVPES